MKRLLLVLAFTSLSAILLIGCGSSVPDTEDVIANAKTDAHMPLVGTSLIHQSII